MTAEPRNGRQSVQENTSDPRRTIVVSPPFAAFYEATHIPAARRVGNRLLVTGHTGDNPDGTYSDDVEAQLRQVFRNVEATLHEAGAGWADVVALTSYHVGLQAQAAALLEVAAEFLAEPYPAWTAVGVTELIDPPALVEISCEAALPDGS